MQKFMRLKLGIDIMYGIFWILLCNWNMAVPSRL